MLPGMPRKSRISAEILSVIAQGKRHGWTLDELSAGVRDSGAPADFSSVFRAAERLVAEGRLRKLLLEDGRVRFELATAHHDHFLCDRCHDLVPIPCVISAAEFAALERAIGAAISGHQLMLNGICANCRTGDENGRRRT